MVAKRPVRTIPVPRHSASPDPARATGRGAVPAPARAQALLATLDARAMFPLRGPLEASPGMDEMGSQVSADPRPAMLARSNGVGPVVIWPPIGPAIRPAMLLPVATEPVTIVPMQTGRRTVWRVPPGSQGPPVRPPVPEPTPRPARELALDRAHPEHAVRVPDLVLPPVKKRDRAAQVGVRMSDPAMVPAQRERVVRTTPVRRRSASLVARPATVAPPPRTPVRAPLRVLAGQPIATTSSSSGASVRASRAS